MEHAHLDLLGRQFLQRIAEDFGGATHVGFENEGEFFDFARSHLFVELLERQPPSLSHGSLASLVFAIHHDLLGLAGVGYDLEAVAGIRKSIETQNFDRR